MKQKRESAERGRPPKKVKIITAAECEEERLKEINKDVDAFISGVFGEWSHGWLARYPGYTSPMLAYAPHKNIRTKSKYFFEVLRKKYPALYKEKKSEKEASFEKLKACFPCMTSAIEEGSFYPFSADLDKNQKYLKERRLWVREKLEVECEIKKRMHNQGKTLEEHSVKAQINASKLKMTKAIHEDRKQFVFLDLEWLLKNPERLKTLQKVQGDQSAYQTIILSDKPCPYGESLKVKNQEIQQILKDASVIYTKGILQFPDVIDCLLQAEEAEQISSVKLFSDDLTWGEVYGFETKEKNIYSSLESEIIKKQPAYPKEEEQAFEAGIFDEWLDVFFQQGMTHHMRKDFPRDFLPIDPSVDDVRSNGVYRLDKQEHFYSHVARAPLNAGEQLNILVDAIIARFAEADVIKLLTLDIDGTVVLGSHEKVGEYFLNGGSAEDWEKFLNSVDAVPLILTSRTSKEGEYAGLDMFMPILSRTNPLPSTFLGSSCTKGYFLELLVNKLKELVPTKKLNLCCGKIQIRKLKLINY